MYVCIYVYIYIFIHFILLLGGTCSTFCNFILPSMIALKLNKNKSGYFWLHNMLIYSMMTVAFIVGSVSTFYTIKDQLFV